MAAVKAGRRPAQQPRRSTVVKPKAAQPSRASAAAATKGNAAQILARLMTLASQSAAAASQRYFRAEPGGYGQGDRFLGIRVPQLRALARTVGEAGWEVARPLIKSGWHEARALALFVLVRAFERGDPAVRESIYRFYMQHLKFINNWDLVDVSAPHIVGGFLAARRERGAVLTRLAKSRSLWERRIAMLATYNAIKRGDARDALRLAKLLLHDREDLIQKAVGWMLREVGQRVSQEVAEAFLLKHYRDMPRTTLRVAIEKLPPARRKAYLSGML